MIGSFLIEGVGTVARLAVEEGELGPELDHELFAALQRLWHRSTVYDVTPATTVTLSLRAARAEGTDADHYVVGREIEAILTSATQSITHALIRERIGTRLLLHAGCVCHPVTGKAITFVAPGGTGKTTLTCGLAQRYAYVTDETVSLDADGLIDPYPKPLSVVGFGKHRKGEQAPEEFGLVELHTEPTLAALVLIERDETLTEPRVEEVGLLDAIEAMVPQSSSMYRLPKPLQFMARTIDLVGGVQRWTYAEWSDVVALVEDRLGVPE